jgi:hypothetical protein
MKRRLRQGVQNSDKIRTFGGSRLGQFWPSRNDSLFSAIDLANSPPRSALESPQVGKINAGHAPANAPISF